MEEKQKKIGQLLTENKHEKGRNTKYNLSPNNSYTHSH